MNKMCMLFISCCLVCGCALRATSDETSARQKHSAVAEAVPVHLPPPETTKEIPDNIASLPQAETAAQPPITQMYELDTRATLTAVPTSNTRLEMHLSNPGPINGIQFTLTGISITSVQTTSRASEFMAKFNPENGKVIMFSVSQTPIPPGEGSILEVVGENARSAKLTDIQLVKSNRPEI